MCLDWDSVVWFVTVVRRGRLSLVINRLTTVHTDCVLRLVSLEALHSHSFPRRAPSGIAHVLTSKQKRAHFRARGAMIRYRLASCARGTGTHTKGAAPDEKRRPCVERKYMSKKLSAISCHKADASLLYQSAYAQ